MLKCLSSIAEWTHACTEKGIDKAFLRRPASLKKGLQDAWLELGRAPSKRSAC